MHYFVCFAHPPPLPLTYNERGELGNILTFCETIYAAIFKSNM